MTGKQENAMRHWMDRCRNAYGPRGADIEAPRIDSCVAGIRRVGRVYCGLAGDVLAKPPVGITQTDQWRDGGTFAFIR